MTPSDEKDQIRREVWDTLETEGLARFPFPPHGRIPNFEGAAEAASAVSELEWWDDARVIKSNPDAPQRYVRERALRAGKEVVMAVPRLGTKRPFLRIDPRHLDHPGDAATISGAKEFGDPHAVNELPAVDAIVAGSVAVDETGRRIGKGEGYSDLEFAMLLEYDRIDRELPIVTTVHEVQVSPSPLPTDAHDVPLDWIVTPVRTIRTRERPSRPAGIDWNQLSDERLEEIPALESLAE